MPLTRLARSAWAALVLFGGCVFAQVPSGFITVSGTKILDATGLPASNATFCGQVVSLTLGGGGHTTEPPVCVQVTNGAFTIRLPDTSLSIPQNACIAITVTDNTSGSVLLGNGYGCVQPTSATSVSPGNTWCSTVSVTTTCNFDNYRTNLQPLPLIQPGPVGPKGDPGTASVSTANGTSGSYNVPQNLTAGSVNASLNPAACGTSTPPTWCAGTEMGAWINAAITALPGVCGTVIIPSGTYSFSTQITKKRCVSIKGQTGYGTTLQWTPSTGAALVVADQQSVNLYSPDDISDISLIGPGSGTLSIGVFIGGDSANVLSPSSSFGDFQNFNRVRVSGFGDGVSIGNNAYRDDFSQSMITTNGTGVLYAGSAVNSGEAIGFTNSNIQNNVHYGMDLQSYGDFYLVGSSCDYNGVNCLYIENAASVSFIGSHIEGNTTPFIAMLTVPDPHLSLNLTSTQLTWTGAATMNPLIAVTQRSTYQYASLAWNGGEVISSNTLGAVVGWGPNYAGNLQLYNGVRLDPTVSFLTTTCGLGCSIANTVGGVVNGSYNWQNVPTNGLRVTPSADGNTSVLYGTNSGGTATKWSMDAAGNLQLNSLLAVTTVSGQFISPLPATTAPSGSCSSYSPGTLKISADGHATYCQAGTRLWTTLY